MKNLALKRMQLLWKIVRASRYALFILGAALLSKLFLPAIKMEPHIFGIASHIIEVLLISMSGWIIFRAVQVIKDEIYNAFDISLPNNIRSRAVRTQIDFIYRFAAVVIVTVAISATLMTFEGARRIGTSLIASAGIAGIVIGFAAQKSLSNFVAGLQIAFTQPMRLDDVVIVEGEWGRIEEITLTYVVVKVWDLRRLIIPITYFVEKPFQNWTRTSSDILGTVMFYVDYRFPVQELRNELNRVIQDTKLWDKKLCILQVTNFSERTMELRVLVSAANASDQFDLRCFLRERLNEFIQNKFSWALPQERHRYNQEDWIPIRAVSGERRADT